VGERDRAAGLLIVAANASRWSRSLLATAYRQQRHPLPPLPPLCSIRPASDSVITATRICRIGSPATSASSSSEIGEGPSSRSTLASASSSLGANRVPNASSNACAGRPTPPVSASRQAPTRGRGRRD